MIHMLQYDHKLDLNWNLNLNSPPGRLHDGVEGGVGWGCVQPKMIALPNGYAEWIYMFCMLSLDNQFYYPCYSVASANSLSQF